MDIMEENKISIIISAYNESIKMILESVNSIIKQTYKNIEIILINDNPSRKELHEIFLKVAAKDNRVIYCKNERNLGLVSSLNKGINIASGLYIARMDADDIAMNDRLESQLKYLREEKLDIVGSNIIKIDEIGNRIGDVYLPIKHEDVVWFIEYGSCLLHPTWLCKKDVYQKLNGYRNVIACEDYDFLIRAIRSGFKLGNIPKIGLKYRIRRNGISQTTKARQFLTMLYISKRYRKKKDVDLVALNNYLKSREYKLDSMQYEKYGRIKSALIAGSSKDRIKACFFIWFNKFWYIDLKMFAMRKKMRWC